MARCYCETWLSIYYWLTRYAPWQGALQHVTCGPLQLEQEQMQICQQYFNQGTVCRPCKWHKHQPTIWVRCRAGWGGVQAVCWRSFCKRLCTLKTVTVCRAIPLVPLPVRVIAERVWPKAGFLSTQHLHCDRMMDVFIILALEWVRGGECFL